MKNTTCEAQFWINFIVTDEQISYQGMALCWSVEYSIAFPQNLTNRLYCSECNWINYLTLQEVRSLSVVLYLNNFNQPASRDGCCPNEDRSQAAGIRLSVHDHDIPTDMTRGVAVSSGTEATVIVTEVDRRRLVEPYGNCTSRVHLGDPSDNLKYSAHGCQQLCLQNKVYDWTRPLDLLY